MIKKLTGKRYAPSEFKALNQCVYCGKLDNIYYGGICEDCKLLDFQHCIVCDRVLRTGSSIYYTYDTRNIHREDVAFNPINEMVREFVYKDVPVHEKHSEFLCKGCIGFEKMIKNECFMCQSFFNNSRENYIINGNVCDYCSTSFEKEYGKNN